MLGSQTNCVSPIHIPLDIEARLHVRLIVFAIYEDFPLPSRKIINAERNVIKVLLVKHRVVLPKSLNSVTAIGLFRRQEKIDSEVNALCAYYLARLSLKSDLCFVSQNQSQHPAPCHQQNC